MIFITGGAFQGKLAFARSLPEAPAADVPVTDGGTCLAGEIGDARILYALHLLTRRALSGDLPLPGGADPMACLETLLMRAAERHPNLIVISDELGCGIVPADRADRLWREQTGRLCAALARRSVQVYRVVCGIGVRIR